MKNMWRKVMLFAVVLLGVSVFPAGVQAKKVTVQKSFTDYRWSDNAWVQTQKRESVYNKKGQIKKEIYSYNMTTWDEATGKAVQNTQKRTDTYTYGKNGQISKIVSKGGDADTVTTYKYTKKAKKVLTKSITEKRAGKTVWSAKFTYDKKGNMTKAVYTDSYTDGKKNVITYTYKNTYKKGVLRKCVTKSNNYQSTDTYNAKGIRTKTVSKDSESETVVTYYANGNRKKATQTMGTYKSVTQYYKDGREKSGTTTAPDGSVIKYTYTYKMDKSGNVKQQIVKANGTNVSKSVYTYTKVNQ